MSKIVIFLILFLFSFSSLSQEKWTLCDEYAFHPDFMFLYKFKNENNLGVNFNSINFKLAEKACLEVLNKNPKNSRFKYLLGRVYHSNNNLEKALKFYSLAARENYWPAFVVLSDFYSNAVGLEGNLEESFKFLKKAEKYADIYPYIYARLGFFYDDDESQYNDEEKAFNYYLIAERMGESIAYYRLAECYQYGECNQDQDDFKAFEYFKVSAEKYNNPKGMIGLGIFYQEGRGTPRDFNKAFELMLKAADFGEASAYLELGHYYTMGTGVDQNYKEAFHWYKKSADKGLYLGQYYLALSYQRGLGVKEDFNKALKYFKLAAAQYDISAMISIGRIYEIGLGVDINLDKALDWYEKALSTDKNIIMKGRNRAGEIEANIYYNRIKNKLEKRLDIVKNLDFGNYHALLIGNNNYHVLPNLNTAINDALNMSNILQHDYGFRIKILQDATRSEILDSIDELREELTINDNLLIYFAGHGTFEKETGAAYWHPVDSAKYKRSNWIPMTDITTQLKAFKAKHIMIIADSCHSGAIFRGIELIENPSKDKAWLLEVAKTKARTAMTSGNYDEVVSDAGGLDGHTWFTGSIIKALKENENVLLGDELYDKIKKIVKLNVDQNPKYGPLHDVGSEGGDFIFVKK